MKRNIAEDMLEQINPNALFADGFDDCILGICDANNTTLVAYDADKILKKLVKQGMSEQGAREYFDFNIAGAYVGEGTPLFVETAR